MSAVLSQDGTSIWLMAWLDECPKAAAEVPRTALLRLLAENDKLGGGKFFAYIPSNRRFVLQQVVPNEHMTAAKFKVILQDLDLPAHRGLRNAQLLRRTGEAEVTRSRLEDDQTIRGR